MQKETAGDQELNLKKRARRRLVGAIALVLLMIIVLPMILKDRAAPNPQEKITISLPGEQQTVTPAAPIDFESSIVPAEPSAATSQTTEASEPAPPPTVDPEASVAKAEKPASDKALPVKEVPSKEVNKTNVDVNHKCYVQIGVFSDEANVKQLQSKLSDLGYKSQTEKIDTAKGKKIRLRTQLFADRNEAAIALQNIKDAGLTGMVVSQ